LEIQSGSRVFVTAKSSDDWWVVFVSWILNVALADFLFRWTGQIEGQGKEGLFPASYVKLL
jgi:hypothetical protein